MLTVSVFYGIVVWMFFKDHSPPHFHARYGEFKATIDIDQLRLLEGDLPRRALDLVLDWANQHQGRVAGELDSVPGKATSATSGSAGVSGTEAQRVRRAPPNGSVTDSRRTPFCACSLEGGSDVWDVVEVEPEPDFCLRVTFADGLSGRVRLAPQEMIGALTPLRDADFFARVFVDQGAVAWPGEIDLAPDAMYFEIQKRQPDPVQ